MSDVFPYATPRRSIQQAGVGSPVLDDASQTRRSTVTLRRATRHPARLLAASGVVLLATLVVGLGVLTMRSLHRIEQIHDQLQRGRRLEHLARLLQTRLLSDLTSGVSSDPAPNRELQLELTEILALGLHADPQTASRLEQLHRLFESGGVLSQPEARRGLAVLQDLLEGEMRAQTLKLAQIRRDAALEIDLTIGALVALVLAGALTFWVVRRWIVRPLNDLGGLFDRLAERHFTTAGTAGIDPILVPLFENYNYLVRRLEALEAEHVSRADSLRDEVRQATRALLEQHRTLASAERLAALGVLAAGLAHELRNPLAGIHVSLKNLRRELVNPDLKQRLDLLVAELERVTRLLNDHLAAVRHAPEPLRTVSVNRMIGELATLVGYQVADHIRIDGAVEEEIECRWPRDRVRQALLNLVLNSVEALGEREGTVHIAAERDGGQVVLTVKDDGPGFPEDILQRPVRAFGSRRVTGTGLGLAMVRRTVEELDGELILENRAPHGATARLRLPCDHG